MHDENLGKSAYAYTNQAIAETKYRCMLFTVHPAGASMWTFNSIKGIKNSDHRLAWMVAIGVDALQILGLPFFAEGVLSPADTVLDLAAAAILTKLLGWHWAFLPTIAAELLPGVDLFPTWTAAVFFVTRQRMRTSDPEILPPGPAPEPR